MNLKNKVVVVTGGASGIGAALCRRFAEEEAKVVVVDIDAAGAAALAEEIGAFGLGCDVTREADVVNVVEKTQAHWGPIDLFCSNAGIFIRGDIDVDNARWQKIWEVNVMAHIYAARAVIPQMLKKGRGTLIITASAAGLLSQIGSMPYSATKHAAVGLAENLAITYGDRGIQVAVICPQAVHSAMTRRGAGVAGVNGIIEPEVVSEHVIDALADKRFLILPHPEVRTYIQRKTSDYDGWIGGMQRLQRRYREKALETQS
ncbi:short-chain dehydrogenase/reductase [Desulfosarcina variabilis str. Montpellier]|uniref:SDR family oxidoreductase n=1 Tax=Desulfosarcina variabilis TaxID=2300 RepID=UPI003AFB12F6